MSRQYDDREIFAIETVRAQRERSHIFVRKLMRRGSGFDPRPTHDAREVDVATFASVYNAADFAAQCDMPLDTLVTLDLARMGAATAAAAQLAVTKFLKCYNEWADTRRLPVGWIYAIECNPASADDRLHAHIALHVPGNPSYATDIPHAARYRSRFREWARGYVARRLDAAVPRAIHISGSLRESMFRHWNAVTYLVKGYDRRALVQSGRSSPDGRPIYLGDLIPWPYCNPGAVSLPRRINISHNLGPKQRAFGAPPRLEDLLPTKPNWAVMDISRTAPLTLQEKLQTRWTLIEERPFQTLWEDGVRDVRKLYPHDFYRFVTKQDAWEAQPSPSEERDDLTCQLRLMADG